MRRWILPVVFFIAACASAQTNTPTPTPTPTNTPTPTPTNTPPFPQTTQITGLPSQGAVVASDYFVIDKDVSGVRRTRKVLASAVGDFLDSVMQWDAVRVEDGEDAGTFTVMDDVDMDDGGDINFTRAAGPPDIVTATIRDGKVTEPKLDVSNSPSDEFCLSYEASASKFEWQVCSSVGFNSPGGNDTEVQYNDAGLFGGDPGLTYNDTTNVLTSTGGSFVGSTATSFALFDEAATCTNPSIVPDRSNPDTGLGNAAACTGGAGVTTVVSATAVFTAGANEIDVWGRLPFRLYDTDSSNFLALRAPGSVTSNQTCQLENDSDFIPDSCVGNGVDGGVAAVADGTGIDGTAGTGDTYTPTFDATEINSAVWGNGSFSSFTFNTTGTPDADLEVATGSMSLRVDNSTVDIADAGGSSGRVSLQSANTNLIVNDDAADSYIDFNVDGAEQFFIGYGPDGTTRTNWNGALWWDGVQTEACPDSGNGSAGTVTINPTKSYIWVGTFDADGCNITMGEPVGDMEHGFVIELVSNTSGTISLADSAGVTELTNGVTWTSTATFSGIKLRYVWTDADVGPGQWVEMSRSHPNAAIGGGDLVFSNADGPAILNIASSCTNPGADPTLIPDRGDTTTGYGGSGATLCLVSGGVPTMTYSSSIVGLLPDDDDGAGRIVVHDSGDLWFEDRTSSGGESLRLTMPSDFSANRTVTIEDDTDPIPFSAVAGACADVAAGLGDETGSCGAVVLSTAPTISSPVLAGTPAVGDAAGNDKLEFVEEAGNPSCSAGNYYIWANSSDGKLKKCEDGSISNLDNVGFGGSGGGEYNPDNYPPAANLKLSDEFTSGATLTWTQRNADTQTVAYSSGLVFLGNEGNTDAWHGITTSPPSDDGTDFWMVAKMQVGVPNAVATRGCGISIITGGSAATPTEINSLYYRCTGASCAAEHLDHDDYDFAGTTSIATSSIATTLVDYTRPAYLYLLWSDTAEDINAYWSWGGIDRSIIGSDTTTDGYPVAIGLFSRDDIACSFDFVRVLNTSAVSALVGGLTLVKIGS